MRRLHNPNRSLAAMTSRAVTETDPLFRFWAGLPPLPEPPPSEPDLVLEPLRVYLATNDITQAAECLRRQEVEHG